MDLVTPIFFYTKKICLSALFASSVSYSRLLCLSVLQAGIVSNIEYSFSFCKVLYYFRSSCIYYRIAATRNEYNHTCYLLGQLFESGTETTERSEFSCECNSMHLG